MLRLRREQGKQFYCGQTAHLLYLVGIQYHIYAHIVEIGSCLPAYFRMGIRKGSQICAKYHVRCRQFNSRDTFVANPCGKQW